MIEGVKIQSAEGYFEEYGRQKLYEQKMDKEIVRRQLINEFHNEIFSLVAMRAKKQFKDIPKEGDPEAIRIARNVVRDETKKWLKLVKMFEQYRETSGVIKPEDLSMIPEGDEIGFDNGELVTRDVPAEVDGYSATIEATEDKPEVETTVYDGTAQIEENEEEDKNEG